MDELLRELTAAVRLAANSGADAIEAITQILIAQGVDPDELDTDI